MMAVYIIWNGAPVSAQTPDLQADFARQSDAIRRDHVQRLEKLAEFAFEKKLSRPLRQTLQQLLTLDENSETGNRLYEADLPPGEPEPTDYRKFRSRQQHLNESIAEAYVLLAQWCREQSLAEEAARCIENGLRLAPHHETLHAMRGEEFLPGYGWLPAADAARYKSGQRQLDGEWKPKADVDVRRKSWANAWELRSDHWLLKTNCDEAVGLAVLADLDAAVDVFVAEFGDTFEIREPVEKMRVNLYASRGQLIAKLKELNPSIQTQNTIGNYSFTTGESYFYYFETRNDEREITSTFLSTFIHEATHQMFDKLTEMSRAIGEQPNFWVVEGLADYVGLTFTHRDGVAAIGSESMLKSSSRWLFLQQAGAVFDTANFVRIDRAQYIAGPMEMHYAQSAGLAFFLMEGRAKRYRARFKEYARIVYAGASTASTFAEVFGEDAAGIHEQFLKFLSR